MSSESHNPSVREEKTQEMRSGTEIDQAITQKREALASAPADQMMEIVGEIQALEEEGRKFDAQHAEAVAENEQRDVESQQAFDTAHDEAHEENARLDAEQQRIAALDGEIVLERSKLASASADGLSGIVQRIKELEAMKRNDASPDEDPASPRILSSHDISLEIESKRAPLKNLSNAELERAFVTAHEERDGLNAKITKYNEAVDPVLERVRTRIREGWGSFSRDLKKDLNGVAGLSREAFLELLVGSGDPQNPSSSNLDRIKLILTDQGLVGESDIGALAEILRSAKEDAPSGSSEEASSQIALLLEEFSRRGLPDPVLPNREETTRRARV